MKLKIAESQSWKEKVKEATKNVALISALIGVVEGIKALFNKGG